MAATQQTLPPDLETLIADYHDFNPCSITTYPKPPTPIAFSKQVSKGLPCVYPAHDLLSRYKASTWTRETLAAAVTEPVDVSITPDGRADALCTVYVRGDGTATIANGSDSRSSSKSSSSDSSSDSNDDNSSSNSSKQETIFLQPANTQMTLSQLLSVLSSSPSSTSPSPTPSHAPPAASSPKNPRTVHYLQSQNSNLTSTPLSPLFAHLPPQIPFATATLNTAEAINLWIGTEESTTSTHRDPYENLYVVLRGTKVFTLWPPVEEVVLDIRLFRTGRYTYDDATGEFGVVLDDVEEDEDENEDDGDGERGDNSIPWVTVDPLLPRGDLDVRHPFYRYARPHTVEVHAGQMLYLPAGWFHHVAQQCGTWDDGTVAPCISVNYWYDQDYEGEKYIMRQLVGRLAQRVRDEQHDMSEGAG